MINKILDDDTVKLLIVSFIVLEYAKIINLDNILNTDLKKNIYNLILILLIIYYCNRKDINNINIGLSIIIGMLLMKNICIKYNEKKVESSLLMGGNDIDEDELINIQKDVLDNTEYSSDDDNDDDYDAYGGKEMNEIDNELEDVYKEYLSEKKKAEVKKNEFKDLLVENKLSKNIKKIKETNEMDKKLKKLEKMEKEYKNLSGEIKNIMEGGTKSDSKSDKNDFSAEVERIAKIKKSVERNKKLYDLNKDGKLDMNDMPNKESIEKYKKEIDKVMNEEKDLFNLSEDSPILEEWSEAFKNNFNMKKIPKTKEVIGGEEDNNSSAVGEAAAEFLNSIDFDKIIGGYNNIKNINAKIESL